MRIGELAQASGTPVETIRFYEREGLLPTAARTEGNRRITRSGWRSSASAAAWT